ncbi:MAG: acyltransferase [Victivallales bacterium]|nr:acyltransferase [Victivallales bacterium]
MTLSIDQTISSRLKSLSVLAMIAILWLHGYAIIRTSEVSQWNYAFETFLWRQLTTWAVPTFFIMSGFFFSWSYRDGYHAFLKKKTRQLLIPYLLWCLYSILIVVPLTALNNHLAGAALLCRTPFEKGSFGLILNKIFAFTIHSPKANRTLWYLRDLMFIFAVAPLWSMLSTKLPAYVIGLVAIVFLCGAFSNTLPYLAIKYTSIGWFTLGLAIQKGDWLAFSPKPLWSGCCWIALAFLHSGLIPALTSCKWYVTASNSIIGFSGALFFWSLTLPLQNQKTWQCLSKLLSATFFIYCCHFPICLWVKSIGRFLSKGNEYCLLATSLLTPFITLLMCILLQRTSQKLSPKLTSLLSGGR